MPSGVNTANSFLPGSSHPLAAPPAIECVPSSMVCRSLPLSTTSRIPTEVYERILDHMHDNVDALKSCSAVCKSWLPTCRYHLFEEIRLTPAFVTSVVSSEISNTAILPYVRRVALGGVWFEQERVELGRIIEFLIHLESPKHLVLETWSWGYLTAYAEQLLLYADGTIFNAVTSIEMTYVRFSSLATLKAFLNRFCRLERLSLDNVTWGPDFTAYNSPLIEGTLPHFAHTLHHLRVNASPLDALLAWIFPATPSEPPPQYEKSITFPRLVSLSIPEVLEHEVLLVQEALLKLGASLKVLQIGLIPHACGSVTELNDIAKHLDLYQNTNLQHLHIDNLTLFHTRYNRTILASGSLGELQGRDVTYYDEALNWVSSLVSSVNSDAFSSLTMALWLTSESDLDLLEWDILGKLLFREEFADKFVMRFLISGVANGAQDVSEWIEDRFANLSDLPAEQIELEFT